MSGTSGLGHPTDSSHKPASVPSVFRPPCPRAARRLDHRPTGGLALPCRRSRVRVPSSACRKAPHTRGFLVPERNMRRTFSRNFLPRTDLWGASSGLLARKRVAEIESVPKTGLDQRLRVCGAVWRPDLRTQRERLTRGYALVGCWCDLPASGGIIIRVSGVRVPPPASTKALQTARLTRSSCLQSVQ
jgi:hypothetical protein